jgi:hypothetical protein
MKTLILALTSALVFQLQSAVAASPEEEARFLAAVRQGFDKQDTNALFALTCWDRVPEKSIEYGKAQLVRDITTMKVSDMKLIDADPKFPDREWKDKDGVAYRSNLPVIKQLKITFVPGGRFKQGVIPVGDKDGILYMLEPAPVK